MSTVTLSEPTRLVVLKRYNDSLPRRWICTLLSLIPVLGIWAAGAGAMDIDIIALIFNTQSETSSDFHRRVLVDIRLPRLLMTFATGAGLALCGVVLQSLFRNPLAEPGLLGISSGAALFAALGFLMLSAVSIPASLMVAFIPMMAFFGAGVAVSTLFILNYGNRTVDTLLLILSGVAINATAMTLLGIVTYLVDDSTLRLITFWSMGSYSGLSWKVAIATFACVSCAMIYFYRIRGELALMSFSEKQAVYQGVNTSKVRICSLAIIALVTAFCVSFTGIVGFVGLVVPHLARMLIGTNLNFMLPLSTLMGGCLVCVADTISRTIIIPAELPIGLITSALGIPFFLYLIVKGRR
jgi:iron complex transport system permease protein